MANEVTVVMPLVLTAEMLRAIREHPNTRCENKSDEHRSVGWLLAAWEIVIELRHEPKMIELCAAQLPATESISAAGCPIQTVGDLRRAIDGRAADELVLAQVVAADGTAWNMAAVIAPIHGIDRGVVIDMRHPELKTLP